MGMGKADREREGEGQWGEKESSDFSPKLQVSPLRAATLVLQVAAELGEAHICLQKLAPPPPTLPTLCGLRTKETKPLLWGESAGWAFCSYRCKAQQMPTHRSSAHASPPVMPGPESVETRPGWEEWGAFLPQPLHKPTALVAGE